jgi:pimeloyl-ACP methyl ester carboxylesterase
VKVLAGDRSDYVRPEHHAEFRRLFPRVTMEAIPAGHWLHADNPRDFLAAVTRWLE